MRHDDLGHPLDSPRPARRVVSLVPSLTETLASTNPDAVVGATDWCTHPPNLRTTRVRGTKNPDVTSIVSLAPDLVIANKEENRELDVRRLREAGVRVWVTQIETLDQAFDSIERMFDAALGWPVPRWVGEARDAWAAPPALDGLRVSVPIWRDPWMVIGPGTFTADVLRRLGCVVLPQDAGERYPGIDVTALDQSGVDVILLPDEPYVFTADDGPEAFATAPCELVSGRLLTWYGPSLVPARTDLESVLLPWHSRR